MQYWGKLQDLVHYKYTPLDSRPSLVPPWELYFQAYTPGTIALDSILLGKLLIYLPSRSIVQHF